MIHCLRCGAETSNGLALCELCQAKALLDMEFLPVYFRNLARWRPGRAGSRDVPGSRVLWMGEMGDPDRTGDRISDRLDEASNMLTTWARVLADLRPYLSKLLDRLSAARASEFLDEPEMVAWLCRGFTKYLTSAATLDWCGEFARDLARHEEVLRGLTEAAIPGWYAGACRHCAVPTYVVPGLHWTVCQGCGATTSARDHLEVILDEARGWVDRPRAIAGAVVALVDGEQSVDRLYDRIRKWESLDWITPIRRLDPDGDPIGPKRYRLGDVLDRLNGTTRMTAV